MLLSRDQAGNKFAMLLLHAIARQDASRDPCGPITSDMAHRGQKQNAVRASACTQGRSEFSPHKGNAWSIGSECWTAIEALRRAGVSGILSLELYDS